MNNLLEEVCDSLEEISEAILNLTTENRPLVEVHGWNHPAINREELASISEHLAKQIRNSGVEEIDNDLSQLLEKVPSNLKLVQTHTLQYFFNGNGTSAIPAYLATISWISSLVQPLLSWQTLQDPKAMPQHIVRRIRSLNAQLDDIEIDKDSLNNQISLIQDATETAESLPVDLQSLKKARDKINLLLSSATDDSSNITNLNKSAVKNESEISDRKLEADKLVDQCEEAYRITTTKGLAGAFEQRAGHLANSMWVWVVGLLASLIMGVYVGSERLDLLLKAISAPKSNANIIILQSVLSMLSLGAPLWFAWLATKQIGQRFRLAEDYAYKASVAKAYEGYKKEAARIDETFEARLFSTALTRVEEAPLRLIEESSHGSPWHELVSSEAFRDAMNNFPELRDKFIDIAKEGLKSAKSFKKKKEDIIKEE